ncbi:MAG: cytochrome b/b6 domain-containing protein [Rubrivivax sp.]|nr:cytochrome b/b6 domain-containing protein [Rubrivivax sp.]
MVGSVTTRSTFPEAAAAAPPGRQAGPAAVAVRVWDLPTRLFHWLLALTIIGSVVTAKIGGGAMVWHFRLGFLAMGLLLFRIAWGFVGGRWSRFASFVRGPGTVWRYLRGAARPGEHLDVGHNPLGAGSVLAMLALLVAQVSTGLVADDEIANVGPLNKLVETGTGLAATSWHKTWGQWIIITLVVLHVAAIAFYLLKKRVNLVGPMWRGDKPLAADVPASRDDGGTRALAAVLAALAAAGVTWVVRQGG